MCRTLGFASLTLAVLLGMTPTGLQAQKKDKGDDGTAEKATAQEYAALRGYKQISGTIFYVDPGSKTLTLRIDIPHMEPNPNYKPQNANGNNLRPNNYNMNRGNNGGNNNPQQKMHQLMQKYQQAMHSNNPQQKAQQMAQIQMQMQQMQMQSAMQANMQAQRAQMAMMQQMAKANANGGNQPFMVKVAHKDFDLEMVESIVVRKMFLNSEYDDQGNLKTYTKSQIAELKGKDASKPGYAAKFDDVQPGQEVVVYLGGSAAAPAKKDNADAGAKKDADAAAPSRPVVSMIVMTKERGPNDAPGAADKKKKK